MKHSLRRAVLGSLLALMSLGTGATCAAAPEDGGGTSKLQVRVENLPGDDGRIGAYFSAQGQTQPLVDGAQLEVTLSALGRSRDFPVKITRAVVKDNQYAVAFPWKDRIFAPLVYEVKVELKMDRQPKSVQNWIMTEYGYSQSHREVIDKARVPLGSREERVGFAIKNIDTIKGMVGALDERRGTIAGMAAQPFAEVEEGHARLQELTVGLIAYRREVDDYFKQYVILLEQGFYKRILGHLRALDRILRDYGRGVPHIDERLDTLHRELAASIELIKQYAPVPAEETLIPEGDVGGAPVDEGSSEENDPAKDDGGED